MGSSNQRNPPASEKVDGPALVAAILKRLPAAQKSRLLESMESRAPEITLQVEKKLYDFEDLSSAPKIALQSLARALPHSDLVNSLRTASPAVQAALLDNLTAQRRELIQSDLRDLPAPSRDETEKAQMKVMRALDQLAGGTLSSPRRAPKAIA